MYIKHEGDSDEQSTQDKEKLRKGNIPVHPAIDHNIHIDDGVHMREDNMKDDIETIIYMVNDVINRYITNQDPKEILYVDDFVNHENFEKIRKQIEPEPIGVFMIFDEFFVKGNHMRFEALTKYLKGMEEGAILDHGELKDLNNYDYKIATYYAKFFFQRQKRRINKFFGNIFK